MKVKIDLADDPSNLRVMATDQTKRHDKLVSQGVTQFMKTLDRAVATKSIVITVQPDGYTQLHHNVSDVELEKHLMRVAAGDRKGAVVQ